VRARNVGERHGRKRKLGGSSVFGWGKGEAKNEAEGEKICRGRRRKNPMSARTQEEFRSAEAWATNRL
jgi:hypothetical protein